VPSSWAGCLTRRRRGERRGAGGWAYHPPPFPCNFLRRLALSKPTQGRALTTLREKLLKIGAKAVTHAKYGAFQLAGVAAPRQLFAQPLGRLARLCLAGASG
jgi:hypothetical protein